MPRWTPKELKNGYSRFRFEALRRSDKAPGPCPASAAERVVVACAQARLPRARAGLSEPNPGCKQRCFHSTPDLQLGENVRHVVFDRFLSKSKLQADLLIAQTAGNQFE